MMQYKQTRQGLIPVLKQKLYKNTSKYKDKTYIGYNVTLPKSLIEYLQPEDDTIYFYYKDDELYMTSHNPGSTYTWCKTTLTNSSDSSYVAKVPGEIIYDNKDCHYMQFVLNPWKKDFFTGRPGEISVTIK